jgi:hypothetical protein
VGRSRETCGKTETPEIKRWQTRLQAQHGHRDRTFKEETFAIPHCFFGNFPGDAIVGSGKSSGPLLDLSVGLIVLNRAANRQNVQFHGFSEEFPGPESKNLDSKAKNRPFIFAE